MIHWRKRYGKQGSYREIVTRDEAARFVRGIRNQVRKDQANYITGKISYLPTTQYITAMMNGVLIIFGGKGRHPAWMSADPHKLEQKRKEAMAHAQPVANAVV